MEQNSKKSKYLQKYLNKWEEEFPWLGASACGLNYAFCKVCLKDLFIGAMGKSALNKHQKNFSHRQQITGFVAASLQGSICFVCLTETKENKQIFEIDREDNLTIAEKILECSGVNIPNDDTENISNKICNSCYDNLLIAYKFRKDCQRSYEHFQKLSHNIDNNDSSQDTQLNFNELGNQPEIYEDLSFVFDEDENDSVTSVEENIEIVTCVDIETDLEIQKGQSILCEICGNSFKHKYALKQHLRRHLDIKPYKCEFCSKAFVVKIELDRHMRVHTGEKPYSCQYCHRKFSIFSSRKRHERAHTGERPYSCETCKKTFVTSSGLRKHRANHILQKNIS